MLSRTVARPVIGVKRTTRGFSAVLVAAIVVVVSVCPGSTIGPEPAGNGAASGAPAGAGTPRQNGAAGSSATHTVLVELLVATWCPYCPGAQAWMKAIHDSGEPDFYFVSLIEDANADARQRMAEYSNNAYPTAKFDGGYREVVGTPPNATGYRDAMGECGTRAVPGIVVQVTSTWLGNATVNTTVTVTNNGNAQYNGHLRVYVTERVSRYLDTDNKPFAYGFCGYAWNAPVTVAGKSALVLAGDWNGWAGQDLRGHDYGNVSRENLVLVAAVFNALGQVDACAAAEVGIGVGGRTAHSDGPGDLVPILVIGVGTLAMGLAVVGIVFRPRKKGPQPPLTGTPGGPGAVGRDEVR